MYVFMSRVYINVDNMDEFTKLLYKAMLRWSASKLAVKLCRLTDMVWVWMFGKMPSGDNETSHGGSWIMGWLFWSFVEETLRLNPKIKDVFDFWFQSGGINFAVYGDDDNGSVPKILFNFFNETKFNDYLNRVHRMTMKPETMWHGYGLSTLGLNNELIYRGVVFLKRFFIRRPTKIYDWEAPFPHSTAEFLPFRPITDYYPKANFGLKRVDFYDVAASALGMVYDSMGVCAHTYSYLRMIFHMCYEELNSDKDFHKKIRERIYDPANDVCKKMLYRFGMTKDEITGFFPELKELRKLHYMDNSMNDFTQGGYHWSLYGSSQ